MRPRLELQDYSLGSKFTGRICESCKSWVEYEGDLESCPSCEQMWPLDGNEQWVVETVQ